MGAYAALPYFFGLRSAGKYHHQQGWAMHQFFNRRLGPRYIQTPDASGRYVVETQNPTWDILNIRGYGWSDCWHCRRPNHNTFLCDTCHRRWGNSIRRYRERCYRDAQRFSKEQKKEKQWLRQSRQKLRMVKRWLKEQRTPQKV